MPNYLFQGQADSQGQLGPTLQKVADNAAFSKDKANALEGLFNAALPVGGSMMTYSPEAEAAIRPLNSLQHNTLDKILKQGPVNERQLFEDHGIVKSGPYSYGHFTPDNPKESWQNVLKDLSNSKTPSEMKLSDIFDTQMPIGGNAVVRFAPDSNVFNKGSMSKSGLVDGKMQHDNIINVNSAPNDKTKFTGTVQHELQHVLDYLGGRSYGSNPSDYGTVGKLRAVLKNSKDVPSDFTNVNRYYHNIGEVRARQNDMLNNEPGRYTDISSVFRTDGQPYHPHLLWGE